MPAHTADAYQRHVTASTVILNQDYNHADHAERIAAIKAIVFGRGLDLGQVARAPLHGNPDWRSRPQPPRDSVSEQCRAFLIRQKLA